MLVEKSLGTTDYDAGFEYYTKAGVAMPENFHAEMESADAMFCGSTGQFDPLVPLSKYPDFRTGNLVGFFRRGMGNTIGLRPLRLLSGAKTPLRNLTRMDIMLVRELSEGGYITPGSILHDDVAYDVQVVTRSVTEKLAKYAFQCAASRNGRLSDGKKTITLGNKQGAVACLDFYRRVFTEQAVLHPEIAMEFVQIDALAEQLLKDPSRFDIVVCENMFGDILGDVGACIIGGMGITPTADVGGVTPHFRPNHGTFPRAAGKNFANPTAAILTAKLMLEYLAVTYKDEALYMASTLILRAVEHNFATEGPHTVDMGGSNSSEEVTTAICASMEHLVRSKF
jgi:3-isopropylmalate dehydrogenase/tartrate dehydrogenase/decarboxylase/D-malate dehydrogenase